MTLPVGLDDTTQEALQVVGERWQILERIADGGMGTVYKARHVETQRVSALKVIPHVGAEAEARFRREAEVAARIEHPGVVDVLDAGVDRASGACYIAMELLQGRTLRAVMDAPDTAPVAIFDLLMQALEPLKVVHASGYVHRDLKPDNIFVLTDGRVKLLDFGIAGHREVSGLTQTGTAMGTPHYMSPEQAMNAREATAAADIWAMGVLMYEALSGRRPFEGETAHAVVVHACTQEVVPLAALVDHVDPRLASVIEQCLSKDPLARPPDATSLQQRLAQLVRADSLPATRPRRPRTGAVTTTQGAAMGPATTTLTRTSRVSSVIPQTWLAMQGPLWSSLLGVSVMLLSVGLYAMGWCSAFQMAAVGTLGASLSAFGILELRPALRARMRQTLLSIPPVVTSLRPAPAKPLVLPIRGDGSSPVRIDLYVDVTRARSRRVARRVMAVHHGYRDVTSVVAHPLPSSGRPICWMAAEAQREVFEHEGEATYWSYFDRMSLLDERITPEKLTEVAEALGLNMLSFGHALRARVHRGTATRVVEQAREAGVVEPPVVLVNGVPVTGALTEQNLKWAVQDALAAAELDGGRGHLEQTVAALPSDIPRRMELRQIVVCYAGVRRAPKAVRRSREQAMERAEKLRARACLPGADFADLAMRFGDTDMDLGEVALEDLNEASLHAVMRLPMGGVSSLLEAEDGFRIYQRVG